MLEIGELLKALPVVKWVVAEVRRRRAAHAATMREAHKAQIIVLLERAGLTTNTRVAFVPVDEVGKAIGLSASELAPLLEELIHEGRVFRGIPPRTVTVSSWKPDHRNLYP